jgi:hypothetical protein
LDRHSGQAGDSFSLRLIRLWRKLRPGIQKIPKLLDARFHGHDGGKTTDLFTETFRQEDDTFFRFTILPVKQ